MNFNKDELAKLSPSERIKRLREIEEQSKREMENAKKLLDESQKMIDESQLEMARRAIKGERDLPPDQRIDITNMVRPDQDNIEGMVELAPGKEENDQNITDLYSRITAIADTGVDYNAKNELAELYDEVNRTETYVTAKYGSASEEFESIASSSKRMIKDLLGDFYNDSNKYHPA